ncbi:MAG TPA: MerR family transcriptional regulator [Iamia sp.]|nr:MerR family transcriptional regulator [Iamia sp.]
MSTFTIGQIAERTGFTTSSLRYYEGIGLVTPAARTDAGYRVYDESTVARLAFIARAKQLGCTLEEITDLVAVWDGDRCGPVQRRLHELVTEKVAATQARLAELAAFSDQLHAAATQLGGDPVDGPCAEGCACLTAPGTASGPVPMALVARPAPEVPIACSLPAGGLEDRTAEWSALLDHVTAREATVDGGLRLALDPATPVAEVARLVTAEQDCCAFFSFAVTVDVRGLALEVRAPDDAASLVDALFGAAA